MKLGHATVLLGAAVSLAACGVGISGAVDSPPLFPVERIQPPDPRWDEGAARANGHGLYRNDELAVRDYKHAVENNDVRAMVDLGVMYAQGRGVARDYSEAVALFRRAADAGSAFARYDLGLLHLSGEGVSVDPAEAASLFRQAAKQGHVPSMAVLASLIDAGVVPALGEGEAALLRQAAADRGDTIEIARLVPAYQRGDAHRPVMFDAARKLIKENCQCSAPEADRSAREYVYTATEGTPGALYQLAIRNRDGDGIPKDLREAARDFATAARMGHVPSQYELARMRIDGLGIAKDKVEAEALLIAASRGTGIEATRARDLRRRFEMGLSDGTIDDATKRADLGQFGEIDEYNRPR